MIQTFDDLTELEAEILEQLKKSYRRDETLDFPELRNFTGVTTERLAAALRNLQVWGLVKRDYNDWTLTSQGRRFCEDYGIG